MTHPVRTEARDGVLTITLDRPKANAIDVATSRALYAAFAQLQDDPSLRVGIITGTYSSVFIAAAIVTFWRKTADAKKAFASIGAGGAPDRHPSDQVGHHGPAVPPIIDLADERVVGDPVQVGRFRAGTPTSRLAVQRYLLTAALASTAGRSRRPTPAGPSPSLSPWWPPRGPSPSWSPAPLPGPQPSGATPSASYLSSIAWCSGVSAASCAGSVLLCHLPGVVVELPDWLPRVVPDALGEVVLVVSSAEALFAIIAMPPASAPAMIRPVAPATPRLRDFGLLVFSSFMLASLLRQPGGWPWTAS